MSCEEISAALEIDVAVVRIALEATGGSVALRKEALKVDDVVNDVSEAEAKEMMGIIKNIARDEESGVYARLNAAKYAHGAKRGYHKRHLDLNVGSEMCIRDSVKIKMPLMISALGAVGILSCV